MWEQIDMKCYAFIVFLVSLTNPCSSSCRYNVGIVEWMGEIGVKWAWSGTGPTNYEDGMNGKDFFALVLLKCCIPSFSHPPFSVWTRAHLKQKIRTKPEDLGLWQDQFASRLVIDFSNGTNQPNKLWTSIPCNKFFLNLSTLDCKEALTRVRRIAVVL
jgi:hypothetical protein